MASYRFEAKIIQQSKGHSLVGTAGYICGRTLRDSRDGSIYRYARDDVLYRHIFLPQNAPDSFNDLQHLCDKIVEAEKRRDSRTARYYIGSLPNELLPHEMSRIVREYVEKNFVADGLCAIAAIHEGHNEADSLRNNPHAHIIVSTRAVGPEGFNKTKNRECDQRKYLILLREQWALVQNRAYERAGQDIRVSHKSLAAQGIHDREPTIRLSRTDWMLEQRGEHTPAGNLNRAIRERNAERERSREIERRR